MHPMFLKVAGRRSKVGSIGVACRWNRSLDAGNFELPFVGDLKSVDGRFDMAKRQVAAAAKKQAAAAVYKIVEVVGVSEFILGGCRSKCRRDSGKFAQRLESCRSDQNGHEGGKRQGHCVSDARLSLV